MAILEKTYRINERVAAIVFYTISIEIVLLIIYGVLEHKGILSKDWPYKQLLSSVWEYLFWGAIVCLICCLIVGSILRHILDIDEEKQQRIEDLKEAMQALQEEKKQEARKRTRNVDSPLDGLTDKQIAVVHEVLLSIPTNEKGIIRNSELMGLIHALEADGNLKKNFSLQDIVDWVEELREPDKVDPRFVSEYAYRPAESTITKMGNMVRRGFDKLR